MDVTDATPQPVGRALRRLHEWALASGARIQRFARHPVAEFRTNVEHFGYPVPVVAVFDVVLLVIATVAVVQRYDSGYWPSLLPILAMTLTYITGPLYAFFGVLPKPLIIAVLNMSAAAVFLSQPVPSDSAPFVLIIAVGEVAALTTPLASIPVALVMIAELAFFESIGHVEEGLPVYAIAVLCGWMTGQFMNFQRRYLYQERENQEVRTAAAADEERRRIAREVHDVIAHSLSITLLHVTAARHALQTDRDVDEAVDALTDAERLGRQAMADIRRTVGLLDQRPTLHKPEPGLDDIAELVADFVRAGMEVDYRMSGDSSAVSAGMGLALYRICQESLANIAKHAPGASARLRIALCAKDITVEIGNTLPAGAAVRPGRGMGIDGMRQRTALLGGDLQAGPADDGWRVYARIPMPGQLSCIATQAEDSLRTMLHNMTRKTQTDPAGPGQPQESM
ncbi:sensor histidine kinase [Nocardia yamanashiensis]|uniref:sensor histidine kinase n=1 Tax=Nocardia yamanashiensis TaxID=209247 RepID=UPI000A06EA99|nr:histidine kinase [Nocardia yamanashiensis]